MDTSSHYDLVIVGGGINGCALARAAALRGVRTALLEMRDFGAGVTSRSTRLIHGGLRYLESLQVSLVRESLRDREVLLREFPGQVVPQPFLIPVYAGDSRSAWYLAAGLLLYRALASGSVLPSHRRVSARETLALLPGLEGRGLVGSFEYYDCQAVYPERLALEMALQAVDAGADVRNHARVTSILTSGSRVVGVRFDSPGGSHEFSARLVVNAAGAWIDRVLGLLDKPPARPLLTLVNGAHIVVREFPGAPRHAVYREARSDRRPFFILPWRGLYLIGTTETPFDGDPGRALAFDEEIRYLVREANGLFPGAEVQRESVLYSYSGSRPLLRTESGNLNRASRGHEIVDHARSDGLQGLLTMAGGKLSTAPSFARSTLRRVEAKLDLKPTDGQASLPAPSLENVPTRIARIYGPRSPDLLRYLGSDPELGRPVAGGCRTTRGEVLFAVEREKARTLGDILLRRTGLAFDPSYSQSWAERTAEICASALGWDTVDKSHALREYDTELSRTLRAGNETAHPSATMA